MAAPSSSSAFGVRRSALGRATAGSASSDHARQTTRHREDATDHGPERLHAGRQTECQPHGPAPLQPLELARASSGVSRPGASARRRRRVGVAASAPGRVRAVRPAPRGRRSAPGRSPRGVDSGREQLAIEREQRPDLGLPVVALVRCAQGALAERQALGRPGRSRSSVIASAMLAGEVGSHRTPAPVARTIGAIPGRSAATTGTPAAKLSNSFCGVVYRWFSVVGWKAMTRTSAEAVQGSRSSGGTGGRTRTRPRYGGPRRWPAVYSSASGPKPISTSTADGTSRIASIDCSMPRSKVRMPW